MKPRREKLGAAVLAMSLGLTCGSLTGAWGDRTAGNAVVERLMIDEFPTNEMKWIVLRDKLGRLFVGGDQLHVFDGQSWRSFPVPNTYALRALAFSEDGRLWAAAINDIGYFEEEPLGVFKYHSLIPQLPEHDRLPGDVWACAQVGRSIYFVCQEKVLRWDGGKFEVRTYPGTVRLLPLRLGDAIWFHHIESGLYRLTEAGPELEYSEAELPKSGILGLAKDADGLLLVSATGFYRPGSPARRVFTDQANRFVSNSVLSCFAPLPGGGYAVGTLTGGIGLLGGNGELLRVLDISDGLPTRAISSITADPSGYAWCTSPGGAFGFDALGHATIFDARNGLKGNAARHVRQTGSALYATNTEGTFKLEVPESNRPRFKPIPQFTKIYHHILPFRTGLLLSRLRGLDFFDGGNLRTAVLAPKGEVYFVHPSPLKPDSCYFSEAFGLSQLIAGDDGSFSRVRLAELPDSCTSLTEDSRGQIWMGTESKGAFSYAPGPKSLSPINDPVTGVPLSGKVLVTASDRGLLVLGEGLMLQGQTDGSSLRRIQGAPELNPTATCLLPRDNHFVISFTHLADAGQGIGVLSMDGNRTPGWSELDVPALKAIGFINALEFSEESGRPILWVAGTDGILRLDYDSLLELHPPLTPVVRATSPSLGTPGETRDPVFPFKGHKISLMVFAGDHPRGNAWLVQSRFGTNGGDWSAPSPRRSHEFTNLSEGTYNFEARTVNPGGMVSPTARFAFTVLPPWYRTPWAYGGYATGLACAAFGLIWIRESRIRARHQELEDLVRARTAELLKASAAKDAFIENMSHEIRNPMNGVVGIAESLKIDGLDPESRRKFALLRQCATHLSSLLENILDFSKIQAGSFELEDKPFDLLQLVDSICAITATESERYGIPVEVAVSAEIPRHLTGDRRRILQILLNLVTNAIKFAGRGQVKVTVWCQAANTPAPEVIFAVHDDGPGIAPAQLKKLFVRFERGAAGRQGRIPGTGLGLALSQGLAEQMGGRIWLESAPGEGSCFYFSAPFVRAEPEVKSGSEAKRGPADNFKRALVVDDEEYNRIVLADQLEAMGLEVRTAAGGTEALTLASQEVFEAVFLDCDLPGLSGPEISRRIRSLSNETARSLIVACTAFNTPDKRAECLAAGMNGFVGKPVTTERLREALTDAPGASILARIGPPAAANGPLFSLRRLAARKGRSFAEELALFFDDVEASFGRLHSALLLANVADACHQIHVLTGFSAIIDARESARSLARLESAVRANQWTDARSLHADIRVQLTELRARLISDAQAAQPA